jgi:16S rRNA (cytosine1402-N4)-methyltransferase
MEYHKPVMLKESLEFLRVKPGGKYIDATLGDGGHALEILRLGGLVLGLDVNQGSLDRAVKRIEEEGFKEKFCWIKENFKNIDKAAGEKRFGEVEGIIFDLGISTSQLKDEQMGLSFDSGKDLDMRLDEDLGVKALDLVNGLYEEELAKMFRDFGEERFAKKFAKEIVKARELEKISSAKQLAEIARKAFPGYENGRLHPATRIFMALRILVNNELENLESALPRAGRLLLPGGRMLVISFHSLEDKLVKKFAQGAQPYCEGVEVVEITKKPLTPSSYEVDQNPSARSAKMRVFERS